MASGELLTTLPTALRLPQGRGDGHGVTTGLGVTLSSPPPAEGGRSARALRGARVGVLTTLVSDDDGVPGEEEGLGVRVIGVGLGVREAGGGLFERSGPAGDRIWGRSGGGIGEGEVAALRDLRAGLAVSGLDSCCSSWTKWIPNGGSEASL